MSRHHSEEERNQAINAIQNGKKSQKYVKSSTLVAAHCTCEYSNQNRKKPRRTQLANST